SLPTGCRLRGQNSQRRQACRTSDRATDDVRVDPESQDRQGPRPDDPSIGTRAGGRSDPVVIDRRTFLAGTGAVLLAAPLGAEAATGREGLPRRLSLTRAYAAHHRPPDGGLERARMESRS